MISTKINQNPSPLEREQLVEATYGRIDVEIQQNTQTILDLSFDDLQATFNNFLRNF